MSNDIDGKIQIASVYGGKFFKSTNYGVKWEELKNIPSLFWKSISISCDGKLSVAAPKNENLIYSYDSWETYNTIQLKKNWTSVSVSGNGKFFLACSYGDKLFLGSNNNSSIQISEIGLNNKWMSCCVSYTGKYQTAVSDYVYVSNNYGITWKAKSEKNNWFSVAMSYDGKYQTAVDVNGSIYTSEDYGETWLPINSGDYYNKWENIKDMIGAKYANVSVSGTGQFQSISVTDGKIYVSSDYGRSWNSILQIKQWFGISTSEKNKYQLLCEYSGYLYNTNDYGKTWNTIININQQNWSSVCMTKSNTEFKEENEPKVVNIIMKPEDKPPNILMPIIPEYEDIVFDNQSYVPKSEDKPPKIIIPFSPTGSSPTGTPTGSPTGTQVIQPVPVPIVKYETDYTLTIILSVVLSALFILFIIVAYNLYKEKTKNAPSVNI